jgi:hypothetical protein
MDYHYLKDCEKGSVSTTVSPRLRLRNSSTSLLNNMIKPACFEKRLHTAQYGRFAALLFVSRGRAHPLLDHQILKLLKANLTIAININFFHNGCDFVFTQALRKLLHERSHFFAINESAFIRIKDIKDVS